MSPITAEFEEKQYESAATVELARGGRVFTPGQIEEKILGYDSAALPGAEVAELLERVAGTSLGYGVWLTPNWWLRCPFRPSPSSSPSRFASLLLQYKRPELCISPRSRSFAAHGGAHFRIAFTKRQHKTLVRLDEDLNDAAVVRYAAPSTIYRAALEQWQIDGKILESSNFVSPRRVGLKHGAWTFTRPGRSGFRNEYQEDDESLPSESFEYLLANLRESASARSSLGEHLASLTVALGGNALEERVRAAAERNLKDFDLPSEEDLLNLLRLRLIGLSLFEAEVGWWLVQLG